MLIVRLIGQRMFTETNLKTITTLVAVLGLIFSAVKYIQVQEIEAAKPYLEKKLKWCEEAVETASSLATSKVKSKAKLQRFWELHWGVMGLVEKSELSLAMGAFGFGLKTEANDLEQRSLRVAHACRAELSKDWSPSWAY